VFVIEVVEADFDDEELTHEPQFLVLVRDLLGCGGGVALGDDVENRFGRGQVRKERDHDSGGDKRDEDGDLAAVDDGGLIMRVR